MTDLTDTLYQFLTSHALPGVWEDPEYGQSQRCAAEKERLLRARLDDKGLQLLDDMLNELGLVRCFEREHIFLAALSLSRELAALVRG